MFNRLFSWFENRVDPYPSSEPKTPRNGLFGFIWSNLEGVRGWLVLLALLSGGIGIGEAFCFNLSAKSSIGSAAIRLRRCLPKKAWRSLAWVC